MKMIKYNLILFIRSLLLLAVLITYSQPSLADKNYDLTLGQWSLPKTVESVLQMPAVSNTLSDFDRYPDGKLLILYPGGDEGTLWAHEVKAWLVSLGLSSRQIELRPGSRAPDILELRVESLISGIIRHR